MPEIMPEVMSEQSYPIAMLPIVPGSTDQRPLVLRATPEVGGVLLYGEHPLTVGYTLHQTVANPSYPSGQTRITTQPPPARIDISAWISHFGAWPIQPDQLYTGQSIVDYQDETERTLRYFSGFSFDATTHLWQCVWSRRNVVEVFNSTFSNVLDITLRLDLAQGTGHYCETIATSTAD